MLLEATFISFVLHLRLIHTYICTLAHLNTFLRAIACVFQLSERVNYIFRTYEREARGNRNKSQLHVYLLNNADAKICGKRRKK